MAKIEAWFTQDLNTAVKPHSFPGEVFNNDSLGNLIGVEITKDGEPFELTGSVNGYCVLSNGETIPVAGTRSGNKASIVLPQTAYSVRGVIKITLKLTNGDETTTLLQVVGAVDQSVTGNMVNPGSVVQDWSQQIAAALQELQDAENNFVRVDTDLQGLTEAKKSNGRTNIDAASVSDVDDLKSAITDVEQMKYKAVLTALGESSKQIFYAEPGDRIEIKTADGSNFTANNVYFKRLDGTGPYWGLDHATNTKTVEIGTSNQNPIYYVYIIGGTAQNIIVENLTNSYNKNEEISELTSRIQDTEYNIDEITKNISSVELSMLGKANAIPFYSKANDKITVSTKDGNDFTVNTIYFLDSEKNQIMYYTLLGYGNSRSFTVSSTSQDTYFVYIYGGTSQNIVVLNETNYNDKNKNIPIIIDDIVELTKYAEENRKYVRTITDNELIICENKDKLVDLSGDTADITNPSSSSTGFNCAIVSCSPKETFTINAHGGSGARAYGFIDANGNVLEKANANQTLVNKIVSAPNNSTHLIINTNQDEVSCRGVYIGNVRENIQSLSRNNKQISANEANRLYPFYVADGNVFEISTVDGENFISDLSVIGYGKNENRLASWSLTGYGNKRIITLSLSTHADIEYLAFTASQNLIARNTTYDGSITKYISSETLNDRKSLEKGSTSRFLFFSDVHGNADNVSRIAEYSNKIGNIDAIINGGDLVENFIADSTTWYDNLVAESDSDVLMAIGNHDLWTSAWNVAPATDVYNKFIAGIASSVQNLVQPSDAATNGLCYYYKDYNIVRVIVLSAMYKNDAPMQWDDRQKEWLQSVLTDALSNGKHVICVTHAPYNRDDATIDYNNPLNSFINYKTYTGYDGICIAPEAISLVNDFIQSGGNFVCWLTGHTHIDFVMTNTDHPEQFNVTIATANRALHFDGHSPSDNAHDETNYDCFDYIGVDTTRKIVKFLRIGFNQDSSMRIRNRFGYDYGNHILLSYS